MSAAEWQPVIVALIGALLLLIPAAGVMVKSWLDAQTKTISAGQDQMRAENATQNAQIVQRVADTQQIVTAIPQALKAVVPGAATPVDVVNPPDKPVPVAPPDSGPPWQ